MIREMDRSALSASGRRRESKPRTKADQRERQIVRILALLRLLSQDGALSVHQLAAKFGTRRETIYRDLRVLNDAGYPIAGDDQGRLSRPRILSSNIPDIRFSPAELDALRSAVEQVQVALPESETLGKAKTKLKALLDGEAKYNSFTGGEFFQTWNRGTKEYKIHQPRIALLVEAVLRRRRCDVTYRKPSGARPKTFLFDSYRLLVVSGGLYVVGRVPKYEGVATLSVDRLLSVQLTSVAFEVDPSLIPRNAVTRRSGFRGTIRKRSYCGFVQSRHPMCSNETGIRVKSLPISPMAGWRWPSMRGTIRNPALDPGSGVMRSKSFHRPACETRSRALLNRCCRCTGFLRTLTP